MATDDTLEERLAHKLDNGEISQDEYEELYEKFSSLGLLRSKRSDKKRSSENYTKTGSDHFKGGKVNGPVNIHGRAIIENSMDCKRLSVSGSVRVDGDLIVHGKTSVSGELRIDGSGKFLDRIAVSGSIETDTDLIAFSNSSFAGKTLILGDFITEGKTTISGSFSADNIKSTGMIKSDAKIDVRGTVICDDFEVQAGIVHIGEDLRAKQIRLFTQFRTIQMERPQIDVSFDNISEVLSNVVDMVFPTLIESVKGIFDMNPRTCRIDGDLEGEIIDISHTIIKGDITGRRISIGPGVTVDGKIKYHETIDLPQGHNYEIVKVS